MKEKLCYVTGLLTILFGLSACGKEAADVSGVPPLVRDAVTGSAVTAQAVTVNTNKKLSKPYSQIYGKWKVIRPIGAGYIFSDSVPEDSYIGGILSIGDDEINVKLPSKELSATLKNPKYKTRKQSEAEFFSWRYAKYDSFGFENDKEVPLIEVKDGKEDWDEFGGTIWLRDKNHIVIHGPQYFLAKRLKETDIVGE